MNRKRMLACATAVLLVTAGMTASPSLAQVEQAAAAEVTAGQVAQGEITIDGVLDEAAWRQGQAALPYELTRVIGGAWDNRVRYGLAWDTTYLFVGATVVDSSPRNDSTDPWDDDVIEIYLDGDHNRGTTYDPQDNQIVIGHGDAAVYFRGRRSGDLMH